MVTYPAKHGREVSPPDDLVESLADLCVDSREGTAVGQASR